MNSNLLKYIDEFFKSFENGHTFYIDGDRVKSYIIGDNRAEWEMGNDWYFLTNGEIREVSIMATSLTIRARSGREYRFIAKPKSKKEIISMIKNKLDSLFYIEDNKKEIDEILYLLDGLE